jgi:hypothetical protein
MTYTQDSGEISTQLLGGGGEYERLGGHLHCFSAPIGRIINTTTINKYSVARVRERTIPTERPPLVGEVSAKFCGYRVPRGKHDGSIRPYSRLADQSVE